MKSQDTNKTSEQLQREVHGQIDKIGRNIDNVRSRLSPGAILDDAIFYPHGQSLTDTYTHLKNNPMGTMFLSLGTLLLMEDQKHVTYERRLRGQVGAAVEKGKVQFEHGKDSVSQKASELASKAKTKAKNAKTRFEVKSEGLHWPGQEGNPLMPSMKTDISIISRAYPRNRFIIDTKYYREALVSNQGWLPKFRSENLYQIYAYLRTQENGTEEYRNARGMLLYPTVDRPLDEEADIQGHNIRVSTIDLSDSWEAIEARLLSFLEGKPNADQAVLGISHS